MVRIREDENSAGVRKFSEIERHCFGAREHGNPAMRRNHVPESGRETHRKSNGKGKGTRAS
jgi:hypothetical protein